MYFVGIDWADDHHDIHILDEQGETIKAFRIPYTPQGLQTLLETAESLSPDKPQVLFAIETSQHLLVDALLETGYTVYPVNPKQAQRARERYSVAGAKSDAIDAKGLARFLRNDQAELHPFRPSSDLARKLRLLTRDRQALVKLKTQLVNQLTQCLKTYYPRALELFTTVNSQISLAFLQAYPTPQKATALTTKTLKAFLKQQAYSAPAKADALWQLLQTPQLPVEPFVIAAKSQLMLALVSQLLPLVQQLKHYDQTIARLFASHPDSKLFKSLPGSGGTVVPRLLSEIGDCRDNHPNVNSLQCQAGTAPVTSSSGQARYVRFRRACNKHLRDALSWFAFGTLNHCPWAKSLYQAKRQAGKGHHAALRIVGQVWLKIIFAMWRHHTPYNEPLFLATKSHQSRNQTTLAIP